MLLAFEHSEALLVRALGHFQARLESELSEVTLLTLIAFDFNQGVFFLVGRGGFRRALCHCVLLEGRFIIVVLALNHET